MYQSYFIQRRIFFINNVLLCRVLGIGGLRVVDAAVMPRVPSGSTAGPTIMIAERAADIIRGINSVRDIRLPDEVLEKASSKKKTTGWQ